MTAPANLGFETAGATPGDAASWSVTVLSTFEEIADFGAEAHESFAAGWSVDPYWFALPTTDAAVYQGVSPQTFDSFESGWSNDVWALEFASIVAAVYDSDAFDSFAWLTVKTAFVGVGTDLNAGAGPDAFSWGTHVSAFVGAGTDLTAAEYDSDAFESFESF